MQRASRSSCSQKNNIVSVRKKPTALEKKKKKARPRLIHQGDSYLGSLSLCLCSASRGLSRLVKGHGDLKRENSLLNAGDRSTRLGTERAQRSHQDNFIRDAESNCRGSSMWCSEGPRKFPNPPWPAQGAPLRVALRFGSSGRQQGAEEGRQSGIP